MSDFFNEDCARIRETSPLIHNITNYVAMNFAANALLAIGASPLMSFCPDEMTEIVAASSALTINIGCLDVHLVKAAKIAAATAKASGKPWVLDPVGVGVSALRTEVASDLAMNYAPTVIRGNASEIIALGLTLGIDTQPAASTAAVGHGPENLCPGSVSRGVDSLKSVAEAEIYARTLAAMTGAVVSVSGETDFITDCDRELRVEGGSPLMPRVTAMGCAATAITGAFLAVDKDPLQAAAGAMTLMACCGETAARECSGTGSFAVKFIDALSAFNS